MIIRCAILLFTVLPIHPMTYTDITFELEDGKIFAHKFMMAANCHMIKRMFTPFQFLESSIKSVYRMPQLIRLCVRSLLYLLDY